MLSVQEALGTIAQCTPSPTQSRETVGLNLVGAVLAEDIAAAESVPAFRASIVDGYAVSLFYSTVYYVSRTFQSADSSLIPGPR
jgi:gephyrin